MKKGSLLILTGMLAMIITMMPAAQVLGNEAPVQAPIGAGEKLIGPVMWAVGVVNANNIGTLRVKRINDCAVTTQALSIGLTGTPTEESDVIWARLPVGSVFGLCANSTGQPIITKVKNFVLDDGIASFDAEIQFVVPVDYPEAECQ